LQFAVRRRTGLQCLWNIMQTCRLQCATHTNKDEYISFTFFRECNILGNGYWAVSHFRQCHVLPQRLRINLSSPFEIRRKQNYMIMLSMPSAILLMLHVRLHLGQASEVKVKVKVRVTLRLAVYRQSVRLCAKPHETHDQRVLFQLNSCGNSPYVTSFLTRRWGCLLWICLAFHQVFISHM
jgi:hypothetical protein